MKNTYKIIKINPSEPAYALEQLKNLLKIKLT
jgi:hypothetical protein